MRTITTTIAALVITVSAFATPASYKATEAIAMRDAISSILKGHLVVTAGGKDQQPVVTAEPFDLSTDVLLALGHDKHALNLALAELDEQRTTIMTANGITGRPDDAHDSVTKANTSWGEALKRAGSLKIDLDPIPIEGLQIVKNKLNNDDVFGALVVLLKH